MKKVNYAVVALGSNLGDNKKTLEQAREAITEQIGPIIAQSQEIRTAAWGMTEQPDFLNQVIAIKPTHLPAEASLEDWLHRLLDTTQAIEKSLGRERKATWGPRTCDIDLIFVDRIRIETQRLSLPHPWWRERDFVGGLIKRELSGFLPFG